MQSAPVTHIGKEVDRLGEDDGAGLEGDQPIEYERIDLRESVEYLAQFPQREIAEAIEISERAWRSVVKAVSTPHEETAKRIRLLAAKRRVE